VNFSLVHTDGNARAGIVHTDHGDVPTPVFMPVGTQGTVKAIEHRELTEIGARLILGNTYHLYLRPGQHILEKAGGLHRFMSWPGALLTDSGGYQVFSLSELRNISDEGVVFKSHLDGSSHRFTPESVVDIQRLLGSDIMMVLDECPPHPCDIEYARASSDLTLRWAARCRTRQENSLPLYGHAQQLFGIVQGSVYPDVREECASTLVEMDFPGYAIGGLSVGEPVADLYAMTELCTAILPPGKPRYLMGVGTPENIIECIDRGVDMFDCVLPTRNGRNAVFFTRNGRLNMRNAVHADDLAPVDEGCGCYTCSQFSRAYLRHLFKADEILALQLATIHNLYFYQWLGTSAREAIMTGTFSQWKSKALGNLAGMDAMTAQ
jgi:queuine tRNA-ribosyltransferase